MKRRTALAGAVVLAVIGIGGYGAFRARVRAASRYEAPVFVAPEPGHRAPTTEFLGVRVGGSRLADVQKTAGAWKLSCADRSMRTLMKELRERKRAEIERAEAKGTADTVSGASIVSRHSARDDNPQVRFSCEGAQAAQLVDRPRKISQGRVLYVFDDGEKVVRHASYQRHHGAWGDALADFDDTRAALTARFGEGREAASGPAGTATEALPKYARRTVEWRFNDLLATVTLANLGGRGFSLSEGVEVPFPLRADAPLRP